METARLVPNLGAEKYTASGHVTALDYLPAATPLALFDSQRLVESADERFEAAQAAAHARRGEIEEDAEPPAPPESRFLTGASAFSAR